MAIKNVICGAIDFDCLIKAFQYSDHDASEFECRDVCGHHTHWDVGFDEWVHPCEGRDYEDDHWEDDHWEDDDDHRDDDDREDDIWEVFGEILQDSVNKHFDLFKILDKIFQCQAMKFGLAAYDADVGDIRVEMNRDQHFELCEMVCAMEGQGGSCNRIRSEDLINHEACDRYGFNGLSFSPELPNSDPHVTD